MSSWAEERGIDLDYIDPGKPVHNCFAESFNGTFRDVCLNANWFTSLEDARSTLRAWKGDYNSERPHSALGGLAPLEYISKLVEGEA